MESVSNGNAPSWNDRLFAAAPVSPVWVAAVLWMLLVSGFLATVYASGDLAEILGEQAPWWQHRDARLAVLLLLLAAYLPAARRYETLGTRANLEDLRARVDWSAEAFEDAIRDSEWTSRKSRRIAGSLALALIPITALLIDRDPSLYFRRYYWDATHYWTYGLATFFCWNAGILVHSIGRHTRLFIRLAKALPEIDLLDLRRYRSFARQGLLAAIPGVVMLSFLALNLGDRGWFWAIGVLGGVALMSTSVSLFLPSRGLHHRIRASKQSELARIHAAIRGDRGALAESALGAHDGVLGLADLLAYRVTIEATREWAFDSPARARFVLYVAIPLGSWFGGALAEQFLEAALR